MHGHRHKPLDERHSGSPLRDNAAIEKPEYRTVWIGNQTRTVGTAPLPGLEAAPEAQELDVVAKEPSGAIHAAGAAVAAVVALVLHV